MAIARPPRARRELPRSAGKLLRTVRNQAETAPGSVYEGASQAARVSRWRAPTVSPNDAVLWTLSTLRDRARDKDRNDGLAGAAVDRLRDNTVGTGIKPLSGVEDEALRKAIQALWLRWTDESDADGRLDFYGQQAQAARTWLVAGEAFVRLRDRLPQDGLSVPLQIQVLEPDLCPHTYNDTARRIRAGIEFDAISRTVAYHFHPSRPGDPQDFDPARLVRIPADRVLHLYDPIRPGQLRGIPRLTRALIELYELDKFEDATLVRQQIQNLFAVFVKPAATMGGAEALNPLTGAAIERDDAGRPLMTLEPGITQELGPGEDVTFANPPAPAETYPEFVRQRAMRVGLSAGVFYEVLTGDMRGVNDRTMRVILNEFRRSIEMLQHHFVAFQLCRPIWAAWMQRAITSGALPIAQAAFDADPDRYARVKWIPQRWKYINPPQDVQAEREEIRAGFTSRASIVSEHGEDVEVIDAEQAADNARADKLGLGYDSDGRRPEKGGAAEPTAGRARDEDATDDEPEPPPVARDAQAQAVENAIALATKALETVAASLKPVDRTVVLDKYGRFRGVVTGTPERTDG